MAIDWPTDTDFPQYALMGTAQGGPSSAVIETETATGETRTRERYSNPTEKFNVALIFPTRALYQVFRSFWRTTLRNGSQKFNWKRPDDYATAAVCKFVGGRYDVTAETEEVMRVTAVLEVYN